MDLTFDLSYMFHISSLYKLWFQKEIQHRERYCTYCKVFQSTKKHTFKRVTIDFDILIFKLIFSLIPNIFDESIIFDIFWKSRQTCNYVKIQPLVFKLSKLCHIIISIYIFSFRIISIVPEKLKENEKFCDIF